MGDYNRHRIITVTTVTTILFHIMEGEAEPWKKLTKALLGLKLAAAF